MKIAELEEKISYYNSKYWNESDSVISDSEYDLLVEELRKLDPSNRLLLEVNSEKWEWGKEVEHITPMLSLDKVYSVSELISWCEKISRTEDELFDIQLKYDGCAAKLFINSRQLITRGDGKYGIDVSDKLSILDLKIDNFEDDYVIGEIVFTNSAFEFYKKNTKSSKVYKNSRNAVGGILRIKEVGDIDPSIKLEFIDHSFYNTQVKLSELRNFDKIKDSILNDDYPYDGIVIKLADKDYSNSLGSTEHHPRGQLAFKFQDEEYATKLIDVVWQQGKVKLTPVAIIEPVEIGGVTVSRVSLHNAKNIKDLDIKINDIVYIKRSGQVIPYIIRREIGDNRIDIILDKCPVCDSDVRYSEPDMLCTNIQCKGLVLKQLIESVKTLGIEDIGKTTIEKIYNLGYSKVSDLFTISYAELLELPLVGEVLAKRFLDRIKDIRGGVDDYLVLASLNIKGIGKTLSKQLLQRKTLLELMDIDVSELITFDNMGEERAIELVNGLNRNKEEIIKLMALLNIIETKGKVSRNTICFSGSFSRKKIDLMKIAIDRGYTVKDSVTRELNLLVTAGDNTSKVKKANDLGIKIISELEFLNL